MRTITVTSNRLRSNKLIILFSAIATLVCFILLQGNAGAQVASGSGDIVKKYNITLPVSTLGNCASLEECKAYCEDPVNKEACVNFAKSKGFYKEPQGSGNSRARLIIEKAKSELGCNTEAECKEFCTLEENIQKCAEFAKKYSIENGKKKIINNAVLEKAKTALGCDTEETCKALCKLEVNREKCSAFAKANNLSGGEVKLNSAGKEEMAKIKLLMEKCQSDPQACKENMATLEAELNKKSDAYCKSNPGECKGPLKEASRGGKPMPNEEAFENANANAKFCRENPEKCKNASGSEDLKQQMPKSGVSQTKPQVRGVQRVPSFFEWFFNVFLK